MLKKILRRAVFGCKESSDSYIKHLRSVGMKIGSDCVIYAPRKCVIDETRPWMIEIGSNVQITNGVTILTHGYDWSVFKGRDGIVLGSAGSVKIGSNVFIGMNTTILKGVEIGENVVIGANSLINKDVPGNCVVVGNPQRVVSTIDEYLEKRLSAQVDEAFDLYASWKKNAPEADTREIPPKEIFDEFFWLFESQPDENRFLTEVFNYKMNLCGTDKKSWDKFRSTNRAFDGYDAFISYMAARLGKK